MIEGPLAPNYEPKNLTLEEKILHLVKWGKGTSFAELSKLSGFEGDCEWYYPKKGSNIFLWDGISKKAKEIMLKLLIEEKIFAEIDIKEGIMIYLHDGFTPEYPVATRPTKNVYKKPHWLPIVFNKFQTKGKNLTFREDMLD